MKLICYLKGRNTNKNPIVLLESENLDDLKSKAIEYASTNPSFCHEWKCSGDSSCQELAVELDYCLEIRP